MVCGAVWLMRQRDPSRPRQFKAPFINFVAPLGILFNVGMMLTLGWENWARLIIWLALGAVIYFIYGRKHSKIPN
jgi:basic amino acid/polyamine antiporter, APA family